ncbi:hypothetical protein EON83_01755 [bacterium]|nr:MAG: hypothetical protein EON83_01755 [bacterium]
MTILTTETPSVSHADQQQTGRIEAENPKVCNGFNTELLRHPAPAIIAPITRALWVRGPGWPEEVIVEEVARCLLYNSMEPTQQWHKVIAEWSSMSIEEKGWRVPCHVELPYVGEVLRFDIVGIERRELGAWDISIPSESLQEKNPDLACLLTIDLLPDFTAAMQGEAGYLFLPCLSGVLHNFQHRVSRETRLSLYGRQEQWASKCQYNAFGMQQPGASWFCIVTEGDKDAEVVARSCWEEEKSYSVHAGLVYRWEPGDDLLSGDRTARYYLLNPAEKGESGWPAFARLYRRFLRQERGVRTWQEKADSNPHVLPLAHGFLLKIMQGYKSASLDGKGDYQSTTTFREARHIIETMRQDGISSFITAQMVGWNQQGHDGLYPTRFPVNEAEGGEDAFRKLIQWGHREGVCISAHDNYSDSYQNSPEFNFDDVIVLRDGRHWRNIPWSGGFNWRLCPLKSIQQARRDLPRMRELGVEGNYYLDAIASFMTCHSHQHGANRTQLFEAFGQLLEFAREMFGTVSTEVACAAYFPYIDGVYLDGEEHFLDTFTPFRRQWVDETVPFAAIVLHNSVRYHRRDDAEVGAKGRRGALRTLAVGAMPFVEISARPAAGSHQMPHYENVTLFCREAHRLCCVEHVDLVTRDIEDIGVLQTDVFRTRYAGGIETFINSTDEVVRAMGLTLQPQSAIRVAQG